MGQLGFFDADKRLEALSAKGDPLEAIDRLVPWESFRAEVEAVGLTSDELKKSSAGRKPFDALLMFRMLVLQALNNLSDEQVEYQVRDRLSFSRFLVLGNADAKHKLIRHYAVTDAAVPDSQELDGLLDTGNTCNDVFADSAYRSTKIEGRLRASGFKSRIHRRATRNHPLSNAQLKANRNRSKIRARIEHVFGAQESSPGGRIVRTIGIVRARAKIGLQNLAYNIRRLVTLERIVTA